jgi:arabinogalactan oligomer/maltooligosaccharide transport system permease protein
MSTSTPPSAPSRPAPARIRSLRGLAVGLLVVGTVDAVSVWALGRLLAERQWSLSAMVVISAVAITAVYLSPKRVPWKYLLPGMLLMAVFQIYPVGYTVATAFTNYGTGNIVSRQQAIDKIVADSITASDEAPRYSMAVLRNAAGDLRLLLENDGGDRFVATRDSIAPLDPAQAVISLTGRVTSVGEYRRLTLSQAADLEPQILQFIADTDQGEIRPESLTSAVAKVQRLRYDEPTGRIVDILDGTTYRAVRGVFTAEDGTTLAPGFKASIGWSNFSRIVSDPTVRDPFLRVFAWNVGFAAGSVAGTMAIGILLALCLHHPGLRGKKLYRVLLVVPYALPAFMMVLVWSQGLLNPKYGFINRSLGLSVEWLNDPWLARLSILVVNLWLGFPYMFLLATGLLQSIPAEMVEAARVDGATGPQTFRMITFPLLLLGMAPMLISSFAFNFNNFNPIYLMTQGGPPIPGSSSVAGQTDILLSYTFKVAFAAGKGNDYGFASALSVVNFLIVGSLSIVGFVRTRAFKEMK